MIPTVGFNMRKVTKGNVTIKARFGENETSCAVESRLIVTFVCSSGILEDNLVSGACGSVTVEESVVLCMRSMSLIHLQFL